MQLATVKIDPLIQSVWADWPLIKIGAAFKFGMACPLYKVIIKAPANDRRVPRILAIPRGFLTSTASNLRAKWHERKKWIPFFYSRKIISYVNSNDGFVTCTYLSATAIINVRADIVLTIDVTKEGEVYFKLAKYMFNVRLTLFHSKEEESRIKIQSKYILWLKYSRIQLEFCTPWEKAKKAPRTLSPSSSV